MRRIRSIGRAFLALVAFWGFVWAGGAGQRSLIYVGTYSPKEGEGIFFAEFEPNAALGKFRPTGGALNPAALVAHPGGRFLYATTVVTDRETGKPTGGVAAFAINDATGELREIDRRPSGGTGPCYLSIHGDGKLLVVANCGTATVACLSLRPEGGFGAASTVIQHEGKSENSEGKPQAHSITVAPGGGFAIAADLGLDRLFVYRLEDPARMTPHDPPFTRVMRGAGPRHLAFHPTGTFAYSINELNNTITAVRFKKELGSLDVLQAVSTLPADFQGKSFAADVQVHPNGNFLYGSNRGHDSIAIFRIDPSTGNLHSQGQTASGGKFPRSLALDSSGSFLFVANQKSDQLAFFRVNTLTGNLESGGPPISIPQPVCVRIVRRP